MRDILQHNTFYSFFLWVAIKMAQWLNAMFLNMLLAMSHIILLFLAGSLNLIKTCSFATT